ncbi:hypothetical protein ACQVBX_00215 [Dyella sp. KULCS107]|uniref:hypothetical protein n=1 Tax=Dyella sp. KULCS107 TaxID=3422216 RepID=UPI003D6F90F6
MAFALWLVALVLLPWWLGLPLLLGIVAVLLVGAERLQPFNATLRLALRWGLPGVVLAFKRWLGDDALAWTIAAVAALAAFTLLAGLEAWLDRGLRREAARAPGANAPMPEWPEMALAPLRVGGIVELLPAQWLTLDESPDSVLDDGRGCCLRYRRERGFAGYVFDDGTRIEAPPGRLSISPGGRWLALEAKPGVLLWDRDLRQPHRLRRRHLCGWHDESPWLQGSDAGMPLPLRDALRRERVG